MSSMSVGRLVPFIAILIALGATAWLLGWPAWPVALGAAGGFALGLGWPRSAPVAPEEPAAAPPVPDQPPDLRSILDSLPEPMLLLRDGRVEMANRASRQTLGEWIEGQDVRLGLRHPAAVASLSEPLAAGAASDSTELIGIGDPDRPWLMTVAAMEDGRRLVHFSDRSEAIAAEKMRVDFVANASHELRTPLATVLGFIETLQDDETANDRATRLRFLGIMKAEARRMQQLIEDLLSLSRIEAERFRVPSDAVDLVPLIEEVRDGCNQLLAEKRSRMIIENTVGASHVRGDRGQLLQLFRNLVVNALKYGREGEPVTVRLEAAEDNMIRISVIDRGEGIAPEHLPRLTERFYRVDSGRSRAAGGTGLGLAIVKHIVGRHRGRLDIRSRVGEGTRVEVSLPSIGDALS